ncbi:MAG TPA: 1-deoxy-D-xylulose-5-phosphate synthase N-terminal domain-containing protein [Steroidobacteraceae bacterium]|jgi:transketolase|nr:1-deoxy-D-xylulose-5-phosphate synthase N-terminal domain-containing protein [Steroidobacteraceae bacterium]
MPSQQHSLVRRLATRIRLNATRMVAIQGFGYLGQALSSAEIFATLFGGAVLRPGRDRFVLSPGHYVIALYAVAAEVGLLDPAELATYGRDGTQLEAIGSERTPLVDLVCGSLGQGLSAAVGFALAAHLGSEDRDTFAFLSDGEMEEGQVWEAAMFAAHQRRRMGRLVAIIDANDSQVDGPVSSVTTLEPLADKWRAFGWQALEIDGHDVEALARALRRRSEGASEGAPLALIARTSCRGRLHCLPTTLDAHFFKLDEPLRAALEQELTRELESADA